jgi:hypothetical protein
LPVAQQRLVSAGGAQFYVELDEADTGPTTVDDRGGPLSFDGVRNTVEAIAGELAQAWAMVKPTEASVAFGLKLTAKSGKLTGLLVEGGGEASLTVTLTWKQPGMVSTGQADGSQSDGAQLGGEQGRQPGDPGGPADLGDTKPAGR